MKNQLKFHARVSYQIMPLHAGGPSECRFNGEIDIKLKVDMIGSVQYAKHAFGESSVFKLLHLHGFGSHVMHKYIFESSN